MRKGDWIQTYTGKQFYPLDPDIEEIDIIDIAHALSNLCRFNGHCLKFYSVAEHSCRVAQQCENPLEGLLHDASEAYLIDVPKPLKSHLHGYTEIENTLLEMIFLKFGLPWPMSLNVKKIDSVMLATEKAELMSTEPAPWADGEPALAHGLGEYVGWAPAVAKDKFLSMFHSFTASKITHVWIDESSSISEVCPHGDNWDMCPDCRH